jgi:hypothetical protein
MALRFSTHYRNGRRFAAGVAIFQAAGNITSVPKFLPYQVFNKFIAIHFAVMFASKVKLRKADSVGFLFCHFNHFFGPLQP